MNYFENLLNQGYYILIANAKYKNIEFKEYIVKKELSEDTSSIACYLNLKAFRDVKKIFNFPIVEQKEISIHCSEPYSLKFETQTKEALKITFK